MWFHREMNSVFYVNSGIGANPSNGKMETEVRTLKQELARTQDALKAATKRCRDLVRELDNRAAGHESERALRDQQLSRILRALLVLEARLKQEQKSIRQLLSEKDNVIRNQQLEIAKLRRYTKNYIKCKRDPTLGKINVEDSVIIDSLETTEVLMSKLDEGENCSLSTDIHSLKCEIITKLNGADTTVVVGDLNRSIKKTHSFAGSDISKTSLTSSENTDASIITTTTDGTPSLLSTEGFCEGESTDVSPGSTLNKSSRCTPTTVTDSENERTMIFNDHDDDGDDDEDSSLTENSSRFSRKKYEVGGRHRNQRKKVLDEESPRIARTESKDDGMDCNFASDDEEKDQEHIYENSCSQNNCRNLQNLEVSKTRSSSDYSSTDNSVTTKIEIGEQSPEETSGNWYSDPDEDKNNDDVFRHSSYQSNSNHNSVLECVNQILLRDIEEEESIMSISRRYKHRGRIVRFQPARLSDIESVGSEVERRNSEEVSLDKESPNETVILNPEDVDIEDEFGMRIVQSVTKQIDTNEISIEPNLDSDSEESKVIPIVIIEPKAEIEEAKNSAFVSSFSPPKVKCINQQTTTPLMLERLEEKACLQLSAKGLTIAKNLDYEDIESLPGVASPPPKTPPALPPKPQFKNNTLILKKIPSPSFLIDETRKKQNMFESSTVEHGKKIFGLISSPLKTAAKNLSFDETKSPITAEGNFWKNRFNNVRSSFQKTDTLNEQKKVPKVTNIVRHFEEFKIGGETDGELKDRNKNKEKHFNSELDQEFDIRQNFEEFNLDECDLSDDPDRLEGDGSERLGTLNGPLSPHEDSIVTKDNNNINAVVNSFSSGYDHFLEATGLSNKSILTPSRLLSNHKSMLKPKDVKYKNKIKANAILEKHGIATSVTNSSHTHVRHWTGPFV